MLSESFRVSLHANYVLIFKLDKKLFIYKHKYIYLNKYKHNT